MSALTATAVAHPNIAFIKYWGNRDDALRIPVNSSISMNLEELLTRTQVTFEPDLKSDQLWINGGPITGPGLTRVQKLLKEIRTLAGKKLFASVRSQNNFPIGAGIASSAAAFAALSLAATNALGLALSEAKLSQVARLGSGSACRSVPEGFVEWQAGDTAETSYATSIAPPDHWGLVDCIAVISSIHKPVGSSEGHRLAATSPLQAGRVADAPRRLDLCRSAVLHKDFAALASIVELDSNLMHAVMMTSNPILFYWVPATIAIMQAVPGWRAMGLAACYTIDAGPNVHVICEAGSASEVASRLTKIPGVQQVIQATPGAGAHLVASPDL